MGGRTLREGGKGQLLESSQDAGYPGMAMNEALPTEAVLALSRGEQRVTHQVCGDGGGNQRIGPAD